MVGENRQNPRAIGGFAGNVLRGNFCSCNSDAIGKVAVDGNRFPLSPASGRLAKLGGWNAGGSRSVHLNPEFSHLPHPFWFGFALSVQNLFAVGGSGDIIVSLDVVQYQRLVGYVS